MTPTEKARRSDALYFDTKVTSRRALCDMVANLESDLEESNAENAKLFALLKHESEQTEKLRELIVGVHEALCTDKAGIFHKLIIASMEDDMRELGIEVDE